jgi:aminoglycoside phosphotransferase (APT) family kinase protein
VEERNSVERWQKALPGIAPNIYSFQEEGERSAILFEYLPGKTFEELLLKAPLPELEHALRRITETLSHVWEITKTPMPSKARFMKQLLARLDDVQAVHPELLAAGGTIGDVELRSYQESVAQCMGLDERLESPHSVLIHGDFNVDNVIYDAANDIVRFIDLHRSRDMDYVQDVSVFIASNFRLQAFEAELRRRLNWVARSFFEWAMGYSREIGDQTFALRLALGLARSFATSTRFVLDENLAREMFSRSRYILETVAACTEAEPAQFRFPKEVLFD